MKLSTDVNIKTQKVLIQIGVYTFINFFGANSRVDGFFLIDRFAFDRAETIFLHDWYKTNNTIIYGLHSVGHCRFKDFSCIIDQLSIDQL